MPSHIQQLTVEHVGNISPGIGICNEGRNGGICSSIAEEEEITLVHAYKQCQILKEYTNSSWQFTKSLGTRNGLVNITQPSVEMKWTLLIDIAIKRAATRPSILHWDNSISIP